MATPERPQTEEQKKIAEEKRKLDTAVDNRLRQISRRTFLVKSGMVGATAVAAVAVGGLVGGFNIGTNVGAQDERNRLFPKGELSPELRAKLADHLVVDIRGWTAESMRAANLPVPDFPLIIDGDTDPENTASVRKWLAIGPEGIYLPLREGDDSVADLTSAESRANIAAGEIDSRFGYKKGTFIENLEADFASIHNPLGGKTIFDRGHVTTSHQIEIDGIINGIAIGRLTPTDPVTIITFDTTREAPLPAGISAGGFIVAK